MLVSLLLPPILVREPFIHLTSFHYTLIPGWPVTRSTTQHNASSRSSTQQHAAPRSTTQHHAAPRSTTQHTHDTQRTIHTPHTHPTHSTHAARIITHASHHNQHHPPSPSSFIYSPLVQAHHYTPEGLVAMTRHGVAWRCCLSSSSSSSSLEHVGSHNICMASFLILSFSSLHPFFLF